MLPSGFEPGKSFDRDGIVGGVECHSRAYSERRCVSTHALTASSRHGAGAEEGLVKRVV